MPEIEIHHMQCSPDDGIEVSYQEERDIRDGVVTIRTLVIESSLVTNELADIMDTVRDLVDKYAPGQNQQPDSIPVRP